MTQIVDTSRPAVEALIAQQSSAAYGMGTSVDVSTLTATLAALLDERDAAREYVKVHSGLTATDRESELGQRIRDLEVTNRKISERSANHHDNAIKWRERAERAEVGYETMLESLNRVEAEHNKLTAELADETKRADENYDDMHEWRSKARKLTAKLDAVKAAVERCAEDRLSERMQSTPVVAKATIRAILADTDETGEKPNVAGSR